MKNQSVRMKDIAKVAEVSIATVSRALTHPEKVSELTRGRIEQAIIDVGYLSHKNVRKEKKYGVRIILVLVDDINELFTSDIIKGIEEAATQHGYLVLINSFPKKIGRKYTINDYILTRQVDGIILLSNDFPFDLSKEVRSGLPPIVMATEFSLKLGLPSVHIDSLTAAFEAVQYLHQLGHSRIACITGEKKIQRTHNLLHGYTQGLRRYGIECESHFVMYGDLTHEAGERALSSMMELKNPPTAIFCHSDEAASGVLSQAKKMGVGVPRNLSVIGFGDAVLSRHCSPPLSTLGQPSEQIGQHAMLLLLNLIGEKIQSIRSRIFDHILIIRGSTAPPLDKLNELMTEELLDYGAISRSVCKSKKKLTELF